MVDESMSNMLEKIDLLLVVPLKVLFHYVAFFSRESPFLFLIFLDRRPRREKGRRPPRRGTRRPRTQRQTPTEFSTDTVHVSNLDYSVTEEQLKQLFNGLNIIKAVIARFRNSTKSRGYGFVQFASEEDQKKAIEQANETQFEGRKIKVKAAHKRETLADSSEAASSSNNASTSSGTEEKAEEKAAAPAESTTETK